MTPSESARSALDRALASERGIIASFSELRQAIAFRAQCNKLRARERKESWTVRPAGDPLRGITPYEELVIRIEGNNVVLDKNVAPLKIEEI